MLTQKITFAVLHPFVRYVQQLPICTDTYATSANVYPYDCRLFYIQSGRGRLRIGQEEYALGPGQAIMWLSGVDYRIDSAEDAPLTLLGVNFDCTQAFSHLTTPIVPCARELFQESDAWEKPEFTDYPRMNQLIFLPHMQSFEKPLQEMLYEYKAQKALWRERAGSILTELLIRLCRATLVSRVSQKTKEHEIDTLLSYIHAHYTEDIDNETLGALFGYHPNSLSRIFKLYTGRSLHQYIIQYRISRAIDYLLSTDLPVLSISSMVGFQDLCHFSKIFKKKTGVSPRALRNRAVAGDEEDDEI